MYPQMFHDVDASSAFLCKSVFRGVALDAVITFVCLQENSTGQL